MHPFYVSSSSNKYRLSKSSDLVKSYYMFSHSTGSFL